MQTHNYKLVKVSRLLGLLAGGVVWSGLGSAVTAAEEPTARGAELIVNGTMEQGNPPVGWSGSGAISSADTDCNSGKQSLRGTRS